MALSAVCSSFSSFVVYLADDKEGIQTITYWLMGSFAGAKWDMLPFIAIVVLREHSILLVSKQSFKHYASRR
ncbi:MAG: iron chelate uptake ABC transporter family permease subunit [Veillonella sp.]